MKNASDPEVRAAAALVAKSYLYPVDSLVLSPDGRLLDHVCANDLHDDEGYSRLLDAGKDSGD